MLILKRRLGEEIVIGEIEDPDHIRVSVVDVRGDTFALGFDAPPTVRIDRKEIAVKRRNQRMIEQAQQELGGQDNED